MIDKLKTLFANLRQKIEFSYAERVLKRAGYNNVVSDVKDKSIMFTFDGERVAILNMDHDTLGYSIEATVVFSSDVLSLKTISDISNLVFMHRCSSSGIRAADDGRVRINLSYHIGDSMSASAVNTGMLYLNKCLATLEYYLLDRLSNLSKESYDLSMFEDVSLDVFSPQTMGEDREFLYGTWDAYVDSVNEEYSSFVNHPYALDILAKIDACRKFEEVNKVLISEVGRALLEDLVLNRQLYEISKTSYGIN